MNKEDVKKLFDQYKMDDYKFNYKEFLRELNEFKFVPLNFDKERQQTISTEAQESQQSQKFMQRFKT